MTNEIAVHQNQDILLSNSALDSMGRLANMMAQSQNALPLAFQGNPGDCLAVVIQAQQWGMNPYAIAQKTSFINGNISYEAQLVNAVINKLAPIKHRLEYTFFGDWEKILGNVKPGKSKNGKDVLLQNWKPEDEKGIGVTVYTTLNGEDKPRSLNVLIAQAQVRNSPLWVSDPKQQLCYLAVKKWSRLFTPDVIMGVYTPDEVVEFEQPTIEEEIPISDQIANCKNTNELVKVWSALSQQEKEDNIQAKDDKKMEFTK